MQLQDITDKKNAAGYFDFEVPDTFLHFLRKASAFAAQHEFDAEDMLFDLFELLRLEGYPARYPQTPPEFFPFGSNGSDGEQFGFVVHVEGEAEYPTGFMCPMDSEGVLFLGRNTAETLQALLTGEQECPDHYKPFLRELGLHGAGGGLRYESLRTGKRPVPEPKEGWKWLETSDGAGVFAPEHLFRESHLSTADARKFTRNFKEYFWELAEENHAGGHFGSALYYLKELFWEEWTVDSAALEVLTFMRPLYEKLERPHLHSVTSRMITGFERNF